MITKPKILVVDDEKDILDLVGYYLNKEGFIGIFAQTGEEALKKVEKERPHLIVLDLMLPTISGLEVAKILKANPEFAEIPIIMLTAKTEETDVIVGLELGADDYITKPFSPKILIARIKAVLRRKYKIQKEDPEVIKIENLTIYPNQYEVLVDDKKVQLTTSEFKILLTLAKKPNWVFSRGQIMDLIHGEDYSVTERTVDVFISNIRKKLKKAGSLIETVRGIGYKLKK